MPSTLLKGMDLLIKSGTNVLGGQKGASVEMSADLIEVSAKGDGWKKSVAGIKEWKVECDGLYITSDTCHLALQTAFTGGTEVDISLTNATTTYSGKAFVTSISLDAPYDDAMTYKVSLVGNGALTVPTA